MIRYFFAITLAMILCMSTRAQNECNLSAKIHIVETHNNEPVPEIMLFIQELNQNIETDSNGFVLLNNICPGKYQIHIHSYEIADTTVELSITETGSFKIKVKHSALLLHQVEIRSKAEAILLQNKELLDAKKLQANAGKTLSEQLRNITGVSTLSNGASVSKPVIHGLHSNRILILNNGIKQEDQQWGAEHAPNIDPFVANNITVLKGAAGVRYGTDAIGGVILVEPKNIRTETGWAGELNLAAFSNNKMGVASAMVEHRFKRHPEFSFRLQSSIKKGGNYQIPRGYWVANTGVREHNFSGILNYRGVHSGAEIFFSQFNNTLGIYTGTHVGSQQDLYHAIQSPIPLINANFSYDIQRPKQVVTHDLLKIKGYLENNWGVWNLTYAFQHNFRQEYDIMRVDNGKAQLNLTLNTQNIGINFNHKKLGYFTGQMGIDGQYQHNTFRDGDRVFIPSYYSYSAAAYMIERYSKNKWTAEAGVRYDYKHFEMYNPEGAQLINVRYLFDYRNPSATLAFKYQINTKWEVSSTLSNAWRAPQAPELFSAGLHQGGARIELGNRNLSPEKSYSINLSSKYEIANKLKIETSLYTQSIQNFIYLKPGQDMLTIKGYYKTFNYTQINALLYGNDFLAEYFINKHWNVQTSMALVRAWDKSEHTWLILMPSDRFNLGGKFQSDISKTLQEAFVGINTQYVLQQKRIPVNFDQIDYPRPPAAYLLLNAEAGMKINLRKQALFFSITASNLFNTKYRDYMDIFRYFLDQAGTNFIVRFRVPFN